MSAMLSLPENCRSAVLKLLHDALSDVDDLLESQCLQEVSPLYTPGMCESTFLLLARSAVYAFVQRQIAAHAQDDPDALRRHIADTLTRCLPRFADDEMIDRCLTQLLQHRDENDPMHTCAIHQFAAAELLADPPDDPLRIRLHESALRHLPMNRPVDRDDLRLVSLDALFDRDLLPYSYHEGFLRLRLGLMGARRHSCEEIAAKLHLPVTVIRAIESKELLALSRTYAYRRLTE